jgi:excisionase family DNA binding protein
MTEATDPVTDRLLRVSEVADRLGSSKNYVYKLMNIGRLGYVEMPSTRSHNDGPGMLGRRVKESVLEEFIASHAVAAAQ